MERGEPPTGAVVDQKAIFANRKIRYRFSARGLSDVRECHGFAAAPCANTEVDPVTFDTAIFTVFADAAL